MTIVHGPLFADVNGPSTACVNGPPSAYVKFSMILPLLMSVVLPLPIFIEWYFSAYVYGPLSARLIPAVRIDHMIFFYGCLLTASP